MFVFCFYGLFLIRWVDGLGFSLWKGYNIFGRIIAGRGRLLVRVVLVQWWGLFEAGRGYLKILSVFAAGGVLDGIGVIFIFNYLIIIFNYLSFINLKLFCSWIKCHWCPAGHVSTSRLGYQREVSRLLYIEAGQLALGTWAGSRNHGLGRRLSLIHI